MKQEWIVQDNLLRDVLSRTGKIAPPAKRTSVRDRLRAAEARAARAEEAVAKLVAGESDKPATEGVSPTPAEWIHRWNRASAEERIEQAERILALAADASSFRASERPAPAPLVSAEQLAEIRAQLPVHLYADMAAVLTAVRSALPGMTAHDIARAVLVVCGLAGQATDEAKQPRGALALATYLAAELAASEGAVA